MRDRKIDQHIAKVRTTTTNLDPYSAVLFVVIVIITQVRIGDGGSNNEGSRKGSIKRITIVEMCVCVYVFT